MRLITTLDNQKEAAAISSLLANKGIENQLELITNTDWGSPEYGNVTCRVWVIDEDQVDNAMSIIDKFKQNPNDPQLQVREKPLVPLIKPSEPPPVMPAPGKSTTKIPNPRIRIGQPIGFATLYLLLLCTLIFVIEMITTPSIQEFPAGLPYTPAFSPYIDKELLYDYPKAYEIIDKIIKAYGVQQLVNTTEKPVEFLLDQYKQTPYWHGFYDLLIDHFQKGTPLWNSDTPMFEKIQQGEVWRIFTPALLHSGPFHIFFNMLWLIVLGRQMEPRLGKLRYLLFILVTGIFTNTLQYLMGGPNFIGFSGILCAMLAFVWTRQKSTAWEGYRLEGSTMAFMMLFLLTVLGIQVTAFFVEISSNTQISPGIANTAHMAGLVSGYILGKMRFFSAKA